LAITNERSESVWSVDRARDEWVGRCSLDSREAEGEDTGREWAMVERVDCESMIVVKRSVLRIVQIFAATLRDSGAAVFRI
jgi:hypothetical protein